MESAIGAYNMYTGGGNSMLQFLAVVALYAGFYKICEKAGTEGWRGVIPVYNYYKIFQIITGNGLMFLLCFIPFVGNIVMGYFMAKAFGKGQGFMIGLMFLPFIFVPMLGFDDSRYYGPMGFGDPRTDEARGASTVSFQVTKNEPSETTLDFDVEESEPVETTVDFDVKKND
ncbi:MAG: DUF5684 domain-containing protein [Mogibacterium sp.]|nr:DUF5684 domain-containing protein [Mogibacterium sp.]